MPTEMSGAGAAAPLPHDLAAQLPRQNAVLQEELQAFDFAFTISDPSQPDNPIVYASQKFYDMTGYTEHEVLGRNCRFLQGPGTERHKVTAIRDALRCERPVQVCITNYKKGGRKFYNQLYVAPIHDSHGRVSNYIGIQTDVTGMVKSSRGGGGRASLNLPQPAAEEVGGQLALPPQPPPDAPQAAPAAQLTAGLLAQLSCGGVAAAAAAAATAGSSPRADGTQDGSSESSEGLVEVDSLPLVAQLEEGGAQAVERQVSHCLPPPPCAASVPASLLMPLAHIQQSFVLSDPNLPDCPIVYASPSFLALTGYPREQVQGRNCRFLQGPGTDPAAVAKLRDAVCGAAPQPITVTLQNYRSDGSPFWNCLHVAPVRDACGAIVYMIGVQLDVTDASGAEKAVPVAPALKQKLAHQAATGGVRVAVRSLGGATQGLRRSLDGPRPVLSGSASVESQLEPIEDAAEC